VFVCEYLVNSNKSDVELRGIFSKAKNSHVRPDCPDLPINAKYAMGVIGQENLHWTKRQS